MRYCYEADRHLTHNLRHDECHVYWIIYDRQRGYNYPMGFFTAAADAERVVKLLNQDH